jgi:hypothetical protein
MTTASYAITGLDPQRLADLLDAGVDHAGVPVEPFEDTEGGWPLRCCLTDSQVGDRLAIVAFSPFPWVSAYAETGPVVVHVEGCPGAHRGGVPPQFEARRQVLRAYGQRRQVYELNRIVEPGDLAAAITEVLADERVELVQARNVLPGCYSFTATRS